MSPNRVYSIFGKIFMEEIAVAAHELFEVGGLTITNTFLLTVVLTALLVFFAGAVFSKAKIIPGKTQNFLEFILESFEDFVDSITGSKEKTKEIYPLAVTFFLIIWASNLLELVPGVGVFSFLRSPSSDLNFTLALSLIAMTYVNFMALRKLGLFSYLKKFINFKDPIMFFVGILEAVGELVRIISLAMRLFGNLFAGEVLLIITSSLFAYLLPLPFLGLEVLVGFIQAFIFSSLTVIFYSTATELAHG